MSSEPKLSIYEFGEQLLATRDLDPVYVILHEAKLESYELERWLLAYFCFYHMGTASYISREGAGVRYFDRFREAAASKEFPRAHERRHFRGKAAIAATEYLYEVGWATFWQPILKAAGKGVVPLNWLMQYIQTYPQFGPWIAFKVADMIERLGIAKVEFYAGAMFLFDSPSEGAELLWEVEHPKEVTRVEDFSHLKEGPVGEWAVDQILTTLAERLTSRNNKRQRKGQEEDTQHLVLAPPRYERAINVQEAETILCKWKAYMGGHYKIGEDIAACRQALLRFPRVGLCQRLLAAGRKTELW